jgi:nucleoside-diphosphate-sugar epimerase
MATHCVLGVTGAIGFWCARLLLDRGERVVALTRDPDRARERFSASDLERLEIIQGDALDGKAIRRCATDAATLIHAVNVPLSLWEDPEQGRAALLGASIDVAADTGARIVFPANVWVYGHTFVPLLFEGHPFAADTAKGRAAVKLESMLAEARRERGVSYTIVRLPDVYGPFVASALYRSVFQNALTGSTLTWYGSLDTPLELVYVADAARALLQVGLDPQSIGRAFNLPGPEETTARKWLTLLAEMAGTRAHARAIPSPIIAIAGWFNHEAHEMHDLLYLKTRRLILEGRRYADHFGSYPATPYDIGMRETLDWYRAGCPAIRPQGEVVGSASSA